jgi:hypothetical protein
VAPPPTKEREAQAAAQAGREQTTVVALQAAAHPLCLPSPLPPLQRASIIRLLCLKVATIGRSPKTRRAGFGPAGRGASHYCVDTLATSPPSAGPVRRQLSESADPSLRQQQQQPSWSERHLSHILKMSESTKAPKPKNSGPYQ